MQPKLSLIAAAFVAVCLNVSPAAALGMYFNMIDDGQTPARGAVQLVVLTAGRASDKPDDHVCVAYLGNRIIFEDHARLIAMADQAFEEFVGAECWKYGYRGTVDGKYHGIARCLLYLGDEYVVIEDNAAFRRALLDGTSNAMEVVVEYRLKNDIGMVESPKDAPSVEYIRVSQPELTVGPSLREPNMMAVPTEIEPGVTVGLENRVDHTYYGDRKPAHFIFYQTPIPYDDKPKQRALAQTVVRALAADRLKRHELKGVSVGAFNEPKLSRFHFRRSYRYDTDDDGDMTFEN